MAFEELIAQLQAGTDADRQAAASELARDASGVDALVSIVRDKVQDRGREAAVEGLVAAAGNFPERRQKLVDLLSETFNESSGAAWEAASALVELDAPRAMKEMLRAAARIAKAQPGQPDAAGGWVVAHGLSLLAQQDKKWQEQTIGPLAMLLHKDPDSWSAKDALSDIDDDRAFSVLLDAVEEHPDLMGYLAHSPRAAAHADEVAAAVGRFVEMSDHTFSAVMALAHTGRPGVRILMQRLEDPDAEIRRLVRVAVRGEYNEVVPSMLGEIVDGTDLDKARASRALAWLDEAKAVPYLRGLLRDASPMVRLAASDAFAVLTTPPPTRALKALLDDEIPEIRASAVTALAPKARIVASNLAALLSDPHPQVRAAAAIAVADVPGEAVSRALLAGLDDSDERVCAAAASRVAMAGPSAVPALRALLGHPQVVVRNTAASALAGLGEEGLAAIADAATSDIPVVRGAAATGAGARADEASLRILGSLVQDEDIDVRVQALRAVPAANADLLEQISEILHTGGEQERDAAALALLHVTDTGEDPGPFRVRAIDEPHIAGADTGKDAGRILLQAIDDPSRVVVRAILAAINTALASVDPAQEPFPRWFLVRGDGYILFMSEQARAVITALERAAARDPVTARLAAAALETVTRKLEEKLDQGPNELGVAYFEAPSKDPDLQLIEHLSEVAHSVPGEPRYLDATFFQDGRHLPYGEALREEQAYDLEVAVRVSPSGIPAPGGREPIAEPRRDGEIEVLVVAEGRAGLAVEEPVAHIVLPPTGDSIVNAMFRVNAKAATVSPAWLAELRLRLYYRYTLLESAVIRAEIVSSFRREVRSQLGLEAPITLVHDRIERGYEGLQDDIERSLHIDVSQEDSTYLLRFTWEGESGKPVSLAAPIFLTPGTLAEILDDTRRKLLQVTMSDAYALNLEPGSDAYLEAMRTLATAGRDLYTALFRYKNNSAIAEVGRLLRRMPPPAESVVQISLAPNASDFLFPWALLYDASLPDEQWENPDPPDPDGFWGLRYCIEQRLPGLQQRVYAGEDTHSATLRMAFMLWEQFVNSAAHRAAIDNLFSEYPGDLEVSRPPITRASEAKRAMTAETPSNIYYFFAHAHVRNPTSGTTDAFVDAFQGLPDGRQAREAFKEAYDWAVKAAREPSWIELTHGRLRLNDLYAGPIAFNNEPLIFLNACESSQLTPSLSVQSFVEFFLDRGAAAFLGTECTMTAIFAHSFGEFVLRRLLNGETIGAALLAARRHFITKQNPIGLAYNQYGNAGFRLSSTRADTSAHEES